MALRDGRPAARLRARLGRTPGVLRPAEDAEPVPRGPYCGSFFHRRPNGRFDSNILIRSVLMLGKRLRVHGGCGIVADSDPQLEADELGWKVQPLIDALA